MNKFLVTILSLSLLINLTVAFIAFSDESRFIDPDSNDYIALADNLAAFKGYTKGEEPEIFRAPGYPFLITPFRFFFPKSVFPIILFQCLLNTISIFILWHLVLALTGNNIKIAKFAIIIQALSLSSIVFTNKILSETFFTCLLLLFLLLVEKTIEAYSYYFLSEKYHIKSIYLKAIMTGLVGGILVFVRAIFMPFFPLFVIYVFYKLQKIHYQGYIPAPNLTKLLKPTGKILTIIFLIILPFIVIIGGWSSRNYVTSGYKGFSSVGSINIYRYYACLLLAKNNNRTFAEQQSICDTNLNAAGTQVKQAEYSLNNGIPVLKSDPLKYLFLHLKTDFNTLLPAVGDFYSLIGKNIGGKGTLSVIHSKGIFAGVKHYFAGNWGLFIFAIPLTLLLLLKYFFAVIGVVDKIFLKVNITYVIYFLFIAYMIVIPGAVSHPRFRVPLEPLISIMASIGLYNLLKKIKRPASNKKSIV